MPVSRPKAVLFDVNGTLFSLEPVRQAMHAAGLTGDKDLEVWFGSVLRDGIAATAAGDFLPFKQVGAAHLQRMLAAASTPADELESSAADVLGTFSDAQPLDDVGPALRRLHGAGFQLAALTNGTKEIAAGLLDKAGLSEIMAAVMDVSEPQCWKPAAAAYHHAVKRLGLQPEQVMLAAVHPWDTNGAKAAGLQAALITSESPSKAQQQPHAPFSRAPDLTVGSLSELADALCALQ